MRITFKNNIEFIQLGLEVHHKRLVMKICKHTCVRSRTILE